MTTELEQEFYDTFGIEPEFGYWCKRFDEISIADCNGIKEPSKKCAKCENGYIKYRYYPVITAERLLEMICILSQSYPLNYEGWSFFSVQELKEMILGDCVDAAKKLSLSSVFANKIQKLFKEDNQ